MSNGDMQTLFLFPTVIGKFKLDPEFTADEIKYINSYDRRKNEYNTVSSNDAVLRDEPLQRIHDFVIDGLNTYLHHVYRPKFEMQSFVTQSWVNYTKNGEGHHRHQHPNSFLSGVLYVDAGDGDNITFFKTRNEILKIEPNEWTELNSTSWWLEAEPNHMYIFPSELQHMVERRDGEGERVSIAFNSFLRGIMGYAEDFAGLRL